MKQNNKIKYQIFIRVLLLVAVVVVIYIVSMTIYFNICSMMQYGEELRFFASVNFIRVGVAQILSSVNEMLIGLLLIGGAQILVLLRRKRVKRGILNRG